METQANIVTQVEPKKKAGIAAFWLLWVPTAAVFWTLLLFGSQMGVTLAEKQSSLRPICPWLSIINCLIPLFVFSFYLFTKTKLRGFKFIAFLGFFPILSFLWCTFKALHGTWLGARFLERATLIYTVIISVFLCPILWNIELSTNTHWILWLSVIVRNILLVLTLLFALRWAAKPMGWSIKILQMVDKFFGWCYGDKRLDEHIKSKDKKRIMAAIDGAQTFTRGIESFKGWIAKSSSGRQFVSFVFIIIIALIAIFDIANFAITYHSLSKIDPISFKLITSTQLGSIGKQLFYSLCVFTTSSSVEFFPTTPVAVFFVSAEIASSILVLTIFLLQFNLHAESALKDAQMALDSHVASVKAKFDKWTNHPDIIEISSSDAEETPPAPP